MAIFSAKNLLMLMAAVTSAAAASVASTITVTAFQDLECQDGAGVELVLTENGCTGHDSARLWLRYSDFEHANLACKASGVDLTSPEFALGECVPTVIPGTFLGPVPAQGISLNCGAEF
ncbi:hypothetical protein NQ176_g708 [Zarea fungicola]|uniref:Uncharacterized protein n=1 Tax=Zarea fungicola TaxID=93591 RepID=A0ACC1NVR1_9HYPO|nr:hypothetical protein NQ176_g708 [Lecanicillium fungicola]